MKSTDGFETIITNTYGQEDVTNWLIGRLTNKKVDVTDNNQTDPAQKTKSRMSAYNYDATSNLMTQEIIEPNSGSLTLATTFGYDTAGNRTGVSATDGTSTRASSMDYDSDKRFPVAYRNALLQQTTIGATDPRYGGVIESTDANGIVSKSRYDALGRMVASWSSVGVNQTMSYSASVAPAAIKIKTTTSGSPDLTTHVDLFGRTVRTDTVMLAGQIASVDTGYDAAGRKTSISRPYYGTKTASTVWHYEDLFDRVASVVAPDGGLTNYEYIGLKTTVTRYPTASRTDGQVSSSVVNSQGWVMNVTDANQKVTSYSYDPLGNLQLVTKPGGQTIAMTSDVRGRKKQMLDPDVGQINYTYNGFGEPQSEAVTGGRNVTSRYDSLGRLYSRTENVNGKNYQTDITFDCANSVGKTCVETFMATVGGVTTTPSTRQVERDAYSRPVRTTQTLVVNGQTRPFVSNTKYDTNSRLKLYSYPVTGTERGLI